MLHPCVNSFDLYTCVHAGLCVCQHGIVLSSATPIVCYWCSLSLQTVRARVFQAVRILAERFERLALAGRAKKREEEEEEGRREGARPRQRSNKPGRGRRAARQQTESAESRNIRNISSS